MADDQQRASLQADWPAQLTDAIVRVVDQVTSKTTKPAVKVVRAIVYGLIAGLLGIVIVLLGFTGLFRAVDRLRNLIIKDSVWITYLALGSLFTLSGAVLFRMRKPRS
jgi:hypothetical protein